MAAKRKPAIEARQGIIDDIIYPAVKSLARRSAKSGGNKRQAAKIIRSMDDRIFASKKAKEIGKKGVTAGMIRKNMESGRANLNYARRVSIASGQTAKKAAEKRQGNPYSAFNRRYARQEELRAFYFGKGTVGQRGGTEKVQGKFLTEKKQAAKVAGRTARRNKAAKTVKSARKSMGKK